jgi:hypothetical protein
MRRFGVLCLLPLFGSMTQPALAGAKDNKKLTYVEVYGYPDNPAILDKDGSYTMGYLKKASNISDIGKYRSAVFPFTLHKRERICESRNAQIHPNGDGFLIIEFNSFFPAQSVGVSKPVCKAESRKDDISAPSFDQYRIGLWARQAIREGVVAKAGDADDPLCVQGSGVSCPEPDKRRERFDAFGLWGISNCRPVQANCVMLRTNYLEVRSERYATSIQIDYQVRYQEGGSVAERKLIDFVASQPLPPGPLRPGPLRVIGVSSAKN